MESLPTSRNAITLMFREPQCHATRDFHAHEQIRLACSSIFSLSLSLSFHSITILLSNSQLRVHVLSILRKARPFLDRFRPTRFCHPCLSFLKCRILVALDRKSSFDIAGMTIDDFARIRPLFNALRGSDLSARAIESPNERTLLLANSLETWAFAPLNEIPHCCSYYEPRTVAYQTCRLHIHFDSLIYFIIC